MKISADAVANCGLRYWTQNNTRLAIGNEHIKEAQIAITVVVLH